MAENTKEFLDMVANSATLGERFARVQTQVLQHAKNVYGLDLAPEDVAALSAVKISVLSGDAESLAGFERELAQTAKVTGKISQTAAEEAAKTLPSLGESQRRLDAAREAGVELGTPNNGLNLKSLPPEEALRHIMTVASPSQRIALARQAGLS